MVLFFSATWIVLFLVRNMFIGMKENIVTRVRLRFLLVERICKSVSAILVVPSCLLYVETSSWKVRNKS